ncbi:MAG: siroheme synthase CysG [Gammaproteobacteria bacterium]
MQYFPLFTELSAQPCLVVGGGSVARRKILQLLKANARVTVNAIELDTDLARMHSDKLFEWQRGPFTPELISHHLLIIAATSDRDTNRQVADSAAALKRLCNVVDDEQLSSFIMPAVVDRSPLMVAISSGGTSPMLATDVRHRIEKLLPGNLGTLAQWAGSWRAKVTAQLKGTDERRHFWQQVLDGPASQMALDNRLDEADRLLSEQLASKQHRAQQGEAWLVGAGPGDPGLLTLHAARMLQQADIILHDRLVTPAILDIARREAKFIPVGKQPGKPGINQDEINRLLVDLVREGHKVCRIKGGDPFIFGRGGEEALALAKAGLPFRIVPGITAASGCAAYAGVPLTHRGITKSVLLTSVQGANGPLDVNWKQLAQGDQTLVFYIGVNQLAQISRELIAAGRDADCAAVCIENGTTENQRIIQSTLAELPNTAKLQKLTPPALIIVGEVAKLGKELSWFQDELQNVGAPETWAATAQS